VYVNGKNYSRCSDRYKIQICAVLMRNFNIDILEYCSGLVYEHWAIALRLPVFSVCKREICNIIDFRAANRSSGWVPFFGYYVMLSWEILLMMFYNILHVCCMLCIFVHVFFFILCMLLFKSTIRVRFLFLIPAWPYTMQMNHVAYVGEGALPTWLCLCCLCV